MKRLFKNSLILVFASLLFAIIIPIGVVFAICKLPWNTSYLASVFIKIAVSIDQLGNVICAGLFNSILVKSGKPFGLEDDTISEVLSKNQNNLTYLGSTLCLFLEKIDMGHIKNSNIENRSY